MSSRPWDVRLRRLIWQPVPTTVNVRTRVRIMALIGLPLAVWYFSWLLNPDRIGTPYLYALLITAEIFNMIQALGFWWTCASERVRPPKPPSQRVAVDVFVPVYKEPVDIVDLTVAAAPACAGQRCASGCSTTATTTPCATSAGPLRGGLHPPGRAHGAKAGNINNALTLTDAAFIAVFDSDHVAEPAFLEATLGCDGHPKSVRPDAAVLRERATRTGSPPRRGPAGAVLRRDRPRQGRARLRVLLRHQRAVPPEAFESVGGFRRTRSPRTTSSRSGSTSAAGSRPTCRRSSRAASAPRTWPPTSPAAALGRGCLSGLPRALRAKLPFKLKAQYVLSASYFLSGWTVLIYMSFPVIRLIGGGQPIAGITAPEFLLHFAPYFAVALTTVALAGAGSYTFAAFALAAANFWIHCLATVSPCCARRARSS